MKRPPNILFLMSDEHRADVTGYEGNRVIRTPVLDHLAHTGVTFRNAYTPSPISVPARQCMTAGQLPKTCQCDGWVDLTPDYMTLPRRFAQYGYMTTAAGKLHHQGSDQMQGWINRIGSMSMSENKIKGRLKEEVARYALQRRSKENISARKWMDLKEVKRAGIGQGPSQVQDEYATVGLEYFIQDYFIDAFTDRDSAERPVFLYLGLNNPHYPYLAEEEKFKYYLNRVNPYLNQDHFPHPFLSCSPFPRTQLTTGPEGDLSERDIRRATAAYYANIESNEERYQRILNALTAAGQDLDEWIIVYASDHGEMLGEHGIWEKQQFFEASARVPLIIRWPKGGWTDGKVIDQNVNLCDLFTTLCQMAEISPPPGLDSRDLSPLITSNRNTWNNESISAFLQQGYQNVMIKRDHLKYLYFFPDLPEVLFDLQKDSGETVNLITEKRYDKEVANFRKRLAELGYGPDANKNYINAGYA